MAASLRELASPGVPGWGFALFLAVNAVQVGGGVFPFLPMEFQTVQVTLSFYVAQALAGLLTYLGFGVGSYVAPRPAARVLPVLAAPPMIAGSAALIAAMYVQPGLTLAFVICAGVLLGLGSTGMTLGWQRTFSSYEGERGDVLLVVGTGLSALIYFALYLCPVAVTAYLVPLVLLPLCAAALTVSARSIDLSQPMFTDVPSAHPRIYVSFAHDYWRSSLAAGAVGFVAGIMRAVALADVTAGHVVNITSMFGALCSAGVILVLWRRFSFHLSMRKAYRWFFPVLTLAVTFVPFSNAMAYLDVFAGLVYMLYAFVQMVLLVQCAQASRDRGVCPVLTYAFCSGIMHALQFAGFLCGWACGLAEGAGLEQLSRASLLAVWLLGMVLFLIWLRRPAFKARRSPDAVAFVAFGQGDARAEAAEKPLGSGAAPGPVGETHGYARAEGDDPDLEIPVRPVLDRLTKQCEAIRLAYRLSDRETEVMELVARGDTVARIAEKLSVSENTVRTHAKRIYAKLGIHSKQELSDLVRSFRPMEL